MESSLLRLPVATSVDSLVEFGLRGTEYPGNRREEVYDSFCGFIALTVPSKLAGFFLFLEHSEILNISTISKYKTVYF
jgi:hypothetical protein